MARGQAAPVKPRGSLRCWDALPARSLPSRFTAASAGRTSLCSPQLRFPGLGRVGRSPLLFDTAPQSPPLEATAAQPHGLGPLFFQPQVRDVREPRCSVSSKHPPSIPPLQASPCMRVYMLSPFSTVRCYVTLWTAARPAPLSMGFSRQEHWSGLPCPGDLPDPGIEPTPLTSPALAVEFFTASTPIFPPLQASPCESDLKFFIYSLSTLQ